MDLNGPVPGLPEAHVRHVVSLPEQLAGSAPAGSHTQAKPGELLIAWPEVGRLLARHGNLIEVAPAPDADPGKLNLLIYGRARSALIHQRGELPLHAASLAPKGRDGAVAVCGVSGAGKSTLAAELSRRGWGLLADDATRVTASEVGPLAWPSRNSIKLWRDACDLAGLDISRFEKVTRTTNKYYVPAPGRTEPARLAWVFELTTGDEGIAELADLSEKMAVLTDHACRPGQIRPLGCADRHVAIVAEVAKSCRIARFGGARSRPVARLADALEDFVS